MNLYVCPITFKLACEFVNARHRHHLAPQGHKASIGLIDETPKLHGVVIFGRPIAAAQQDGWTAEITRLCTDGTPNACTILYTAAIKCARSMGYTRVITYTLATETGSSLRAAGFINTGTVEGREWTSLFATNNHPTCDKHRWEQTFPQKVYKSGSRTA